LSGLITPSLDEMVHVAREMERKGFSVPLLIGGATTSRVHTAVKIAPAYRQPVVYVPDASRAAGVMRHLIHPGTGPSFIQGIQREQEEARRSHAKRRPQRALLSIEEARERRPRLEWDNYEASRPSFLGARVFTDFPLEDIAPYIDWSPLFHVWELRGRYPKIFEDAKFGERAKELYEDAQTLLTHMVSEKLLTARGIYGFYPANSVGDDIEVYDRQGNATPTVIFHTLRQQTEKADADFNYALADFVAPKATGHQDYIGIFAVTAGMGVAELCAKYEGDHDDYSSIMTKALADRLAEAFAELLHKKAREDWGYGLEESLGTEDLIRERYRGIRPAPGYPACPDHSEKRTLWELLQVEAKTGIALTENWAMNPASSVCGLYFAHPAAKYFSVGKLGPDQIADYGSRKQLTLRKVEQLLSPYLAYTPDSEKDQATRSGGRSR